MRGSMEIYPRTAAERAMKLHEVLLRASAGKIKWWQAAELIGISERQMRLIDAVDAMADNRDELLFELRGATQRQFALYRILRGQAEKLFVTGNAELGDTCRE